MQLEGHTGLTEGSVNDLDSNSILAQKVGSGIPMITAAAMRPEAWAMLNIWTVQVFASLRSFGRCVVSSSLSVHKKWIMHFGKPPSSQDGVKHVGYIALLTVDVEA